MIESVRPFTLHVADADIADLQARLARVRWPDEAPDSAWRYGTSLAFMRELVSIGSTATTGARRKPRSTRSRSS